MLEHLGRKDGIRRSHLRAQTRPVAASIAMTDGSSFSIVRRQQFGPVGLAKAP